MIDWLESLVQTVIDSPYTKLNRFNSFCPRSDDNLAKWYINGHKYFSDLAEDLEKAKHEIYITDWWLSPEVFLKRPVAVEGGNYVITHRLDQILKRAAERGCKVFILLYREFEQALPNNSLYTQLELMKLHPNIEVNRHPANLIFLWSHHEKSVIIDQSIVYMGGLDLCYGRWDLDTYPLTEPGNDLNSVYFPGQDYSNVRIKDFANVERHYETLIDKESQPRMPWRDIAVQLKGPVTKDVTRHFVQYWNFAKNDLEGNNRRNFLYKKDFESEEPKKKPKTSKYHMAAISRVKKPAPDKEQEAKIPSMTMISSNPEKKKPFAGINNMFNPFKLIEDLQGAKDDKSRKKTHMFELRDEAIAINEDKLQEADESKKLKDTSSIDNSSNQLLLTQKYKSSISKLSSQHFGFTQEQLVQMKADIQNEKLYRMQCQICRSAGQWSMGLHSDELEKSIQLAYIELIKNSEHFVYIENQFFVSSTSGKPVSNQIATAIVRRIEKAIKGNQDFKIMIALPLLPGFEGEIDQKAGNVMRIQMGWLHHTIGRGEHSILKSIQRLTDKPEKYIKFYGLRNHGVMKDGVPKTELIYIHSKVNRASSSA